MSKGRSVGDQCEGASVKRRNIFYATVVALSVVCMGSPVPAAADQAPAAKKAPASPTKSMPMGLGGFAAGKLGRNNSLDAGLAALDAALASNAEV